MAIFRQGLEQLHQLAPGPHATTAGVRAFAVALPDRHDARITDGAPEEAWEVLLERLGRSPRPKAATCSCGSAA